MICQRDAPRFCPRQRPRFNICRRNPFVFAEPARRFGLHKTNPRFLIIAPVSKRRKLYNSAEPQPRRGICNPRLHRAGIFYGLRRTEFCIRLFAERGGSLPLPCRKGVIRPKCAPCRTDIPSRADFSKICRNFFEKPV